MRKLKKTVALLSALCILISSVNVLADGSGIMSEDEKTYTESHEVSADENGELNYDFPKEVTIGKKVYTLKNVETVEITERKTKTTVSEKRLKEESEPDFEKSITVDGKEYVYSDVEKKEETVTGRTVSTSKVIERDATLQANTETISVTVVDEETENEIEGEIPYIKSVDLRTDWINDLHSVMTFDHYDTVSVWGVSLKSGTFYIEKNEDVPVPESQYDQVLQYISETGKIDPSREYKITEITWDGEKTGEGAESERDAAIEGVSAHRIVTDTYEGEISLPDLTYVTYTPIYKETDADYNQTKKGILTATYEYDEDATKNKFGFFNRVVEFITTTPGIVTISIAGLVILALIILFIIRKRTKKEEEE